MDTKLAVNTVAVISVVLSVVALVWTQSAAIFLASLYFMVLLGCALVLHPYTQDKIFSLAVTLAAKGSNNSKEK